MINKIILVSKTLPLYSDLECGPAPTYMRKNIRDLTVTAQYSWLVLMHVVADIQKKNANGDFLARYIQQNTLINAMLMAMRLSVFCTFIAQR